MKVARILLGTSLAGFFFFAAFFVVKRLTDPDDANFIFGPYWRLYLPIALFLLLPAFVGLLLLPLTNRQLAALFILFGLTIMIITGYQDRTIPKTVEELRTDARYSHCRCFPSEPENLRAAYLFGAIFVIVGSGFLFWRKKNDQ
jgi:hypothetical protein